MVRIGRSEVFQYCRYLAQKCVHSNKFRDQQVDTYDMGSVLSRFQPVAS
jgi:hypothetical protein